MTAFWCERAWLGGANASDGVVIECTDGHITSLEAGLPAPPGATRLAGVTLPGFANAHSHAFHRLLRGATQAERGSFWTWREAMYRAAGSLDPDGYHELARRVFTEMVAAGYTAVGEFHYVHHDQAGQTYADPNAMGRAVLDAADHVGIRITLLDTLYLHGGLGSDGYLPLDRAQRRFADAGPQAWAERVDQLGDTPLARIGAAVHSVRAVDPDAIAPVAEWAAARAAPLHAHVSEQPAENEQSLATHGLTPVQIFERAGALTERFTAVHATHLEDDDIAALGGAGAAVCVCPTTERDLADGIGPTPGLAAAGATLCIGSDSHAVIDPFEETRAVELNQRLATMIRGNHTGAELLAMATTGGYRALGWDGGRLAVGALGDFVTIDPTSARLRGHTDDSLLDTILFAASPDDVTTTVVGGQVRHRRWVRR